MKKIIEIAFVLVLVTTLSVPCFSQNIEDEPEKARIRGAKLGVSSGFYYKGSDELSKELYGAGNLMYGAYLGADIVWRFEIRAEISQFNDKGKMNVSDEEIRFSMFQYMIGARFRILGNEKLSPYIGGGLSPGSYKEDVPERFDDFSGTLSGSFYVEAGLYFRIKDKLHLDFSIRSIKADVEPFDELIHLGGIRVGLGIEYRF